MKAISKLFYVIIYFNSLLIYGQNQKLVLDSISLKDICSHNICLGDSLNNMLKIMGKPEKQWEGLFSDESGEAGIKSISYHYKNSGLRFKELQTKGYEGIVYGIYIIKKQEGINYKGFNFYIGDDINDEKFKKIFPNSYEDMIKDQNTYKKMKIRVNSQNSFVFPYIEYFEFNFNNDKLFLITTIYSY